MDFIADEKYFSSSQAYLWEEKLSDVASDTLRFRA